MIAGLSATLAHRSPGEEGVWIGGEVGLACRLFRIAPESVRETQPAVHSSGTVLVFDGRLDNREELLDLLKNDSALSTDAPDSAFVLAAYDRFGEQLPERLNGDFALGLFDPRQAKLLLARDAVGVRPLYYYSARELFLFASEIKALLAHPQGSTRPNDDLLADFLISLPGQERLEMTFFQGVFSLPPAHLAVVSPRGIATRRYWDFDPSRRIELGSFAEYAEMFRHHFEQAVERRLRSAHAVAVSVSGGLDSSSIFCTAETLGRRLPRSRPPLVGISVTSLDGTRADENAFVVEIERAYGIAITRIPPSPGFLGACQQAVWHSEIPLLDEQWNTSRALYQAAQARGARVLLAGDWGDQVLFDRAYLIDLFGRLEWGKVWAHLKEFGRWNASDGPGAYRWFRRRFCKDLARAHVPDALIAWLRALRNRLTRVTPLEHWYTEPFQKRLRRCAATRSQVRKVCASRHARSLYAQARSRYYVMCMEWYNKLAARHGLEIAFPFLDRDLIAFMMAVPGEMASWQGVPKALLREAMRGILPEAIARRQGKADFTHAVNKAMEDEFPQVVRYLYPDGLAARFGYVKQESLEQELAHYQNRARDSDCTLTWNLSNLLGLELWLRVFFGDGPNSTVSHDE